jgi:diguanylate cyclase (GGDEF)-like protein
MADTPKFRLWLAAIALLCAPLGAYAAVSLTAGQTTDLATAGQLYRAGDEGFPDSAAELPDWLSRRQPAAKVSLLGGGYWLYAELRNDSDVTDWVLAPNDTLIDRVEARVYPQNGAEQAFVTGYRASHDYMLHYGKAVHLAPGTNARVLIRFQSPYYASAPSFDMVTRHDYQELVLSENVLTLAAFGALLTLALYNLFIYGITRDRTLVFYAAYMITYFFGWAFTFHVPSELLGLYNLHLHYIPFFLLPVLNTLFYVEFLQLKTRFPRLAAVSRVNIVLPLVLLPSCFFALSYAHTLATIAISLWLIIALVSGVASLRNGFRPARYFVLAFIALLIPGLIILPANIGLIPDLVKNSELLTLLGGTLDGILLAFALADKIRILSDEKDQALKRFRNMLALARTDHLTGIANRHAFDQSFERAFARPAHPNDQEQLMLILIDLDGLKRINDRHGHARGDELLCSFAKALARLEDDGISVFRLGGDEFTILACKRNEVELRTAMARLESQLREEGFGDAGISYGIAHANESESAADMLTRADQRMYESKTARRRARAEDIEYSAAPCAEMP